MSFAQTNEHQVRELAYRANDGLEVVLFWHELTGVVTVAVSDSSSGAYFELAADPALALDVFDHPYAYAAFAGIPYEEQLLANWTEAAEPPKCLAASSDGCAS
jgi:hypothetical protein